MWPTQPGSDVVSSRRVPSTSGSFVLFDAKVHSTLIGAFTVWSQGRILATSHRNSQRQKGDYSWERYYRKFLLWRQNALTGKWDPPPYQEGRGGLTKNEPNF